MNKTPLTTQLPRAVYFDLAYNILLYKGLTKTLIKQFKYHNKTSIRRTIKVIFREFTLRHPINVPRDCVVIPMPLHSSRLRERGYNQAALMAQAIAQTLQLPWSEDILLRQRPTASQSQLHAKERWTNVHRAFRILPLANIVGKEIILVDDILTTGATASEAAKTLKQAGALRVTLITLAITACGSCTTTS